MGTPEFAKMSLQKLLDENLQICGVVTQPDKPKGRGHKLQPPPVKELAIEYNIPIFQPETLKNNVFAETLATLNPDIIIVVAYGKILPKYILDFPKFGCVNVHASLLPKYRGAAPINWCIINGEKQSGITTMYMNEGLDTGDMILKSAVEINNEMTVGELHDKLAVLGGEILVETLGKIALGIAPREPQNDAESTYAPMIDRETGRIDWTKSALEIVNLIRGTNPYPGAFCYYNGVKIKIFKASFGATSVSGNNGEIVAVSNSSIEVASEDGKSVFVEEVQFEGGKRMTVANYLNGNKIEVGTVLE